MNRSIIFLSFVFVFKIYSMEERNCGPLERLYERYRCDYPFGALGVAIASCGKAIEKEKLNLKQQRTGMFESILTYGVLSALPLGVMGYVWSCRKQFPIASVIVMAGAGYNLFGVTSTMIDSCTWRMNRYNTSKQRLSQLENDCSEQNIKIAEENCNKIKSKNYRCMNIWMPVIPKNSDFKLQEYADFENTVDYQVLKHGFSDLEKMSEYQAAESKSEN